jgi:cytochrome bd-I ubiquinol oxidase subunit X
MWYFSWILGTGLALTFGVLNAIWYEIMDQPSESGAASSSRDSSSKVP